MLLLIAALGQAIKGIFFAVPPALVDTEESELTLDSTRALRVSVAAPGPAPSPAVLTPKGYEQLVFVDNVTVMTLAAIPATANYAKFSASTNAIRYKDTGAAPDATHGLPILVGLEPSFYQGQHAGLVACKFICVDPAGATLDVLYYS